MKPQKFPPKSKHDSSSTVPITATIASDGPSILEMSGSVVVSAAAAAATDSES
jgi:hypothetical protein